MDRRLIAVAVVVIIVIIAAVAILAMQSPPSGGNNDSGTGDSVEIKNIAFSPATLTVANGTTVTWTNNDSTVHTVTFDNGPFASSGNFGQGQTYSVTFNQVGTFNYHCSIHPNMVAKVIVQ
jgi:plastocyanin